MQKTSQDIDMLALRIDNLQNEFNQLRNASWDKNEQQNLYQT